MNGSNKLNGLISTFILSVTVILIFYGTIIKDPNNYYFSPNGDGFKAYFGAKYHLEYDTTAMRMNGMNYPFGEMVFFTGCEPLVVNSVKFISNHVVDISGNIIGIMNLLMIFSILIAAIFIFLIFDEIKLPWWYSSIVAVGICMLSPQIARMGGHFSLSYLFWIPLMIYLVMRFDRTKSIKYTLFIALTTFVAGGMHLYFVGFFGFILGFYWLNQLIVNRKVQKNWQSVITNFLLQYILPFILIQLLMSINDAVTDRTAFPYGFFAYLAHPVSVFLPNGRPYLFVSQNISVFRHLSWESYAFIGVAALFSFIFGTGVFFKKVFQRKAFYKIIDIPVLNVMFWASFAALLFSFGLPFVLGLEGFVDYLGPIRQLRALSRFSWFFFYVLNIIAFYWIYQKASKENNKVWKIVASVAVFFLYFDGYYQISINSRFLQNRFPEMEDKVNNTEANSWVSLINPENYQAIIPIPYFHVGSENIWIESRNNTQETSMYVSLKTGLPLTGVQLSRTSISQTYLNYSLLTEPLHEFEILKKLPNQKDFLICVSKGDQMLTVDENRIVKLSTPIFENDRIELRKISIDTLHQIPASYLEENEKRYLEAILYSMGDLRVTDTLACFKHVNFNDLISDVSYEGAGALHFPSRQWKTIYEDTLKNLIPEKKYLVSFWIHNYQKDGYLRHNLEWMQKNPEDDKTINYFYSDIHRHIKAFDGDWALIEFSFIAQKESEIVKLSLRNKILKKADFILDELIIRPESLDIYEPTDNFVLMNGRTLKLTKRMNEIP